GSHGRQARPTGTSRRGGRAEDGVAGANHGFATGVFEVLALPQSAHRTRLRSDVFRASALSRETGALPLDSRPYDHGCHCEERSDRSNLVTAEERVAVPLFALRPRCEMTSARFASLAMTGVARPAVAGRHERLSRMAANV